MLRTAPEPLSASDLAERIVAQKGFAEGDAHTFLTIRKCVQSYLRRDCGTVVEPAGRKDRHALWRVRRTGLRQTALPRGADMVTLTKT
jgi:hypothetical protein